MLLPRKMKTPAPTTGSRGSPRHGRTPGHRCLLPVGVGNGCAQCRGGRGCGLLGTGVPSWSTINAHETGQSQPSGNTLSSPDKLPQSALGCAAWERPGGAPTQLGRVGRRGDHAAGPGRKPLLRHQRTPPGSVATQLSRASDTRTPPTPDGRSARLPQAARVTGRTPRAGGACARAPLAPWALGLLAPPQPAAWLTLRAQRTRLRCRSGGSPARHPVSLQKQEAYFLQKCFFQSSQSTS